MNKHLGYQFTPWVGDVDLKTTNDVRAKAMFINLEDVKVFWSQGFKQEVDSNDPPSTT